MLPRFRQWGIYLGLIGALAAGGRLRLTNGRQSASISRAIPFPRESWCAWEAVACGTAER